MIRLDVHLFLSTPEYVYVARTTLACGGSGAITLCWTPHCPTPPKENRSRKNSMQGVMLLVLVLVIHLCLINHVQFQFWRILLRPSDFTPFKTSWLVLANPRLHFGNGVPRIFKIATVHGCIEDALGGYCVPEATSQAQRLFASLNEPRGNCRKHRLVRNLRPTSQTRGPSGTKGNRKWSTCSSHMVSLKVCQFKVLMRIPDCQTSNISQDQISQRLRDSLPWPL